MPTTPEERLGRLARHARRGFEASRRDPGVRERARRWILEHPSADPDLDREWLDSLEGRGELADWLEGGKPPEAWHGSLALHSLLSSHPFADQGIWSIQEMFGAS